MFRLAFWWSFVLTLASVLASPSASVSASGRERLLVSFAMLPAQGDAPFTLGRVYEVDVARARCRSVLFTRIGSESVHDLSSDGRLFAFRRVRRPGEVRVIELATGRARQLPVGRRASVVALSPNGDRLAYARDGQLFVVRTTGGVPTVVAKTGGPNPHHTSIVWSPSGAWLAFTVATGGGQHGPDPRARLDVVRATGGGRRMLYREPAAIEFSPVAAWSPDSTMMVVSGASRGVLRLRPDGTGLQVLAPEGRDAVWSPDGGRVAFTATGRYGLSDVFVVNAGGSGRRAVTATREWPSRQIKRGSSALGWSPNGLEVLYLRRYMLSIASVDDRERRALCTLPIEYSWGPEAAWTAR